MDGVDDIRHLAAAVGLAERWRDAERQSQTVAVEDLADILRALGYPAESAADRRRSRERLAAEDIAPPVLLTGDVGRMTDLPASLAGASTADIAFEQGGTERLVPARGRLPESLPEVRSAIRAGLRYLALDIMADQYHQIDLTPALVARSLGLSVRHLHMLFEDAEKTFGRTLTLMRVGEAQRLLATQPDLTISQVAYASGFESLATFYRVFRNVYGMAPGDARRLG